MCCLETTKARLAAEKASLEARYAAFQTRGLSLNMARGIPAKEQLDLSLDMLTCLQTVEDCQIDGIDARNYGGVDGLPSAKKLFGELLDVDPDCVIVGGNSSLNMMSDMIMRSKLFGIGGCKPWVEQGTVKFLCPVPGYDRHFLICEQCGIEMIPLPVTSTGPDMDLVRELVTDPAVKGMWCIPKYSNPSGITYSDDTVRALASLKPAAPDFRIFWDNAYCIHDVFCEDKLLNIVTEAKKAGNENLVFEFASTSKLCFPGAGVACMVAGKGDIDYIKKLISAQTIGPDKMNQLRHIRYFKDVAGLRARAAAHGKLIRPKFEAVLKTLDAELSGLDFVDWSKPNGGYFISLNVMEQTAKRTVELAKNAGVTLTPAGATWPYRKDPADKNIRIAPSYPSLESITLAAELLCVCVKLAAIEKLGL